MAQCAVIQHYVAGRTFITCSRVSQSFFAIFHQFAFFRLEINRYYPIYRFHFFMVTILADATKEISLKNDDDDLTIDGRMK